MALGLLVQDISIAHRLEALSGRVQYIGAEHSLVSGSFRGSIDIWVVEFVLFDEESSRRETLKGATLCRYRGHTT